MLIHTIKLCNKINIMRKIGYQYNISAKLITYIIIDEVLVGNQIYPNSDRN